MSNHFNKVCQFGKSHGTCRCPSKTKTRIEVPCDRPDSHRPKIDYVVDTSLKEQDKENSVFSWLEEAAEDNRLLTAPSLRDRLLEVVQDELGEILLPGPINHLATALNKAVAEHLRLEADRLER